jgi:hypothetical protein
MLGHLGHVLALQYVLEQVRHGKVKLGQIWTG